jgi:hypothetical protein
MAEGAVLLEVAVGVDPAALEHRWRRELASMPWATMGFPRRAAALVDAALRLPWPPAETTPVTAIIRPRPADAAFTSRCAPGEEQVVLVDGAPDHRDADLAPRFRGPSW